VELASIADFWDVTSGVHRNFFGGGSTNSVEDRGQTEQDSGGGILLVRGSGSSNYDYE